MPLGIQQQVQRGVLLRDKGVLVGCLVIESLHGGWMTAANPTEAVAPPMGVNNTQTRFSITTLSPYSKN